MVAFLLPIDAAITQSKRRCPSLIILDGEDLTRYREASEAIFRSAVWDDTRLDHVWHGWN